MPDSPAAFLRPWKTTDANAVLSAFASPDMARQGGPVGTLVGAQEWLKSRLWGATRGRYSFAVDLGGEAVGSVMLSGVDGPHRTAWVSYWAAPSARGRGITTAAVATAAQWAFGELALFRLELGYRLNNPASGRVAARAGFIREGVERQKLEYGGIRFDIAVCARLITDPAPAVVPLTMEIPGCA